ncbi:TCF3 fusion partner [Emydura macquarii macquarii]|uniref:TCF3 fusion partner n=1 Tax=Emydura macquarii macquarii TaxID=1129001 RepID=UPI00352B4B8C
MAGVGFEEFSVPPGSELALPPLFGGNILESELETEVEFVDGGLSGDNLQEEEEEESQQRQRELGHRKIQALGRRCKELEQVNERVLNRLHQVQKITRRLKQERRFLMRVLDSYGDDYRQSQLTIVLEDEGSPSTEAPTPGNTENEPPEKETPRRFPGPPLAGPEPKSPSQAETPSGKKRRRHGREDKEQRGRRPAPALLPIDDFPVQIKGEDEFPCNQDAVLGPSWPPPRHRDKLLHYPKFSSPRACNEFD